MHTFQLRFACLMLPALLAATPTHESTGPDFSIAANNTDAAFGLYRQIAGASEGNVFFSPFSISTALAMTYAGARGTTADEMEGAMHFGPNDPTFHQAYGQYLQALCDSAEGHIDLRIANRLWGDRGYEFHVDFLALNKSAYRSPLELTDFKHQPEASRLRINRWIAGRTEQRIQDLLPYGSVNEDTRLILTNAIYFKGEWAGAFDPALTAERRFNLADGSKSPTTFMNQRSYFGYNENEAYKMIRLPYKGGRHSMVVVLPQRAEQFDQVESMLSAQEVSKAIRSPRHEVVLALPKFKMTVPLSLKEHLEALGMRTAFSNHADFSLMGPDGDLAVSDVIHKAFIEIDEEGTEAAAATAVVMMQTSSAPAEPRMPKYFIADRPFLFYIVDDHTQSVLFMGRMMDPGA